MAIVNGQVIDQTDFINAAERNATPALDVGRGAKLEDDGEFSELFLRQATKMVASENLNAGATVGVDINGLVSRAFRTWASDATNIPANLGGTVNCVFEISTDKWVVFYYSATGLYAVTATIDSGLNKITFGTQLTITGSTANSSIVSACKVDTDKFVIMWGDASNNDARFGVCTVSGSTISHTDGGVFSVGTFTSFAVCQLGTLRFAFMANGASGQYHGFATVSGTTVTVVASSTASITNITGSSQQVVMTKIATDKHVILSVINGYAVACTSVSTTYTPGTALLIVTPGASAAIEQTSIVSNATNAFHCRVKGNLQNVTASGTTLSLNGSNIPVTGDIASDMFAFGSVIYEITSNSDAALSGLYLIAQSGAVTTRTQLQNFSSNPMRGGGGTTKFLIIGTNGNYYTVGMSSDYLGMVKLAVSAAATERVHYGGKISGLTGILPGRRYAASNGGLVLSSTGTIVGISTTAVVIT